MRVRTSSGIRPIDFLGNFYMTNATEMIFGAIDSDKSVSVELKHDDKLAIESNTYIQVIDDLLLITFLSLSLQAALLYTSISGQRRLRILTLALTVTSSYTSLYPACDLDAIMNYITKIGPLGKTYLCERCLFFHAFSDSFDHGVNPEEYSR